MSEYRITIDGNRYRVEAVNEQSAVCGLLRRMSSISPPSVDRPIRVEMKCGETWELHWYIDRPNVLRDALASAGVTVTHEMWYLDEGRGGLPTSLPLTEWKLIESDEGTSEESR